MGLESGVTYIEDLVDTNPVGATDNVDEGDDHIRNIKKAVQGSFPSLGAVAVNATAAELNQVDGSTPATSTAVSGADTVVYNDSGTMKQVSISDIALFFYPIGAIYASTASTSPATLFGGTWTALADKQTLVQQGTYTAGSAGGSSTAVNVDHTHANTFNLSTSGGHTHNDTGYVDTYTGGVGHPQLADSSATTTTITNDTSGLHDHSINGSITNAGSSGVNANMPPYLAVYMWKRTA